MIGPSYQYAAKMVRVIDGDTYEMQVDLGFRIYHTIHVRLKAFDTAELRSSNALEVQHAKDARDFVVAWLPAGSACVLLTAKAAIFNRWEAAVWFHNTAGGLTSLADLLRDNGYAKQEVYQ